MSQSREQARQYALAVSIVKDHTLETATLLKSLSVLPLPDIPISDSTDIRDSVAHEHLKITAAAARHLHSILNAAAPPWTSFEALEKDIQQRYERGQDLEPLQALDLEVINQATQDKDVAEVSDTEDSQSLTYLSNTKPDVSTDPAKDVRRRIDVPDSVTRTLPAKAKLESPTTLPDPCIQVPVSNPNSPQLTLDTFETQGNPIITKQYTSFGTKENLYIVEPLEDEFARISVTPEVESNPLMPRRLARLASPLTPPNSVRPYRKTLGGTNKKEAGAHVTAKCSVASESSLTKITPVSAKSQKSDNITLSSTSFPRFRKTLQKVKLVDTAEPLASGYQTTYHTSGNAPGSDYAHKTRRGEVTHTVSSALLSKRKIDSVLDSLDPEDHQLKRHGTAKTSTPLEASFSKIGFEFLTRRSVQFSRPAEVVKTKTLSSDIQFSLESKKNQTPPSEISYRAHQSKHSLKNVQLIASTHDVLICHVVRYLRRAFPHIVILERDFTANWISQKGISCDADIILSTRIGIVFATIQEVQQQPLPGSKDTSRFQKRIAVLAPKYETLYVLVNSRDIVSPGTLSKILAFVRQLGQAYDTVVEVEAFSSSTNESLLPRIMELISENHVQLPEIRLEEEEESEQERYLRRELSLNTYAAQAVVQRLMAIDDGQAGDIPTMLERVLRDGTLTGLLDAKSSQILKAGAGTGRR